MNLTRRNFIGTVAGGTVAGLVNPAQLFAKSGTVSLPEPGELGKNISEGCIEAQEKFALFQ